MVTDNENGLRMLDDQEIDQIAGAWFGGGIVSAIGHAAGDVAHFVHDAAGGVAKVLGVGAGAAALIPGGQGFAAGLGAAAGFFGFLRAL